MTRDCSMIGEWFSQLSKREKLVVIATCNNGSYSLCKTFSDIELILEAKVPPKRVYVENGVPTQDYPSYAEVSEESLHLLWNNLPSFQKKAAYLVYIDTTNYA